ncbi:hypothetical protein FACS1894166_11190 [Bacilli bacterium]|nr:hypothetical protein FACS1894166_11190 [Bacilli bacterium]
MQKYYIKIQAAMNHLFKEHYEIEANSKEEATAKIIDILTSQGIEPNTYDVLNLGLVKDYKPTIIPHSGTSINEADTPEEIE